MKRRGMTIIGALGIVVVSAIVSMLGFIAYDQFLKPEVVVPQTISAPQAEADAEPISELDAATSDLESIDLTDESDTTTLESQVSDL